MSNIKQLIEECDLQIKELIRLKNDTQMTSIQTFLQNEIERLTSSKKYYEKALKNALKDKEEHGTISVYNYMWDQNDEHVKIYIENDKNEKFESEVLLQFSDISDDTSDKFTCIFGKYRFTLTNLFSPVITSKSNATLTKSNKLIIKLKKSVPEKWSSMQKKKETVQINDTKEEEEPEKTLLNLMKKIYDEGDDDIKRSIAKSWYETQHKYKD